MGMLSPAEAAEVEQLSAIHPEVRKELHAIELALEQYANIYSQEAPPHIEEQIISRIRQEKIESPKNTAHPPKTINKSLLWLLGIGLLAAIGLAGYLFQQSTQHQQQALQLQTKLLQLEEDCNKIRQENSRHNQQLAILKTLDTHHIMLKGTQRSPQSSAIVHWNPHENKALLDIVQLPSPPADKQYQLWAIVDGQPVDMGIFNIHPSQQELHEITFEHEAQAFAVTLENKGGSPSPTLDEMFVMGEV